MSDSVSSPPDPHTVVYLDNVQVKRSGRTLVGPLTWKVDAHQRWIIIGPNGAGKTSLLSIIAGRLFPTSGKAWVLGEELGKTDISELTPRIGVVSTSMNSFIPEGEKVIDLVVSAAYGVLGKWREEYETVDYDRAYDTLRQVYAAHLSDRRYGTLSEGERKRALLARSLMTDPELLLFDEPGAGLDLGGREDLVEHLSILAEDDAGPAIIVVTHHVEEIPPGFTDALLLSEGKIVIKGALSDVITSENLSETFQRPLSLLDVDNRYFARRKIFSGKHGEHNEHNEYGQA